MSNLPVLWVPPVPPPDPNERPPKRRGNKGVWLAAVAIVALPLLALSVFGETKPKSAVAPTKVVEAETQAPAAPTATAPVEATTTSGAAAAPLGPSPTTSGGNQPYIAGSAAVPSAPAPVEAAKPSADPPQVAAPAAASAPATPVGEPKPALGADGRPVRVIGIDHPSADMAARPAPQTVETPRASEDAKPEAPATPAIAATEPRGSIAAPTEAVPLPSPAPERPVVASPSEPAVPTASDSTASEPAAAASAPAVPAVGATAATGRGGEVPSAETGKPVENKSVETKSGAAPQPLPSKRTATAPQPLPEPTKRAGGGDDFADRLAAIRRSETRRPVEPAPHAVEVPPPAAQPRSAAQPRPIRPQVVEEDPEVEEEVIVVPRRHWGFIPPFFDDGPRRPVLRSYDPPPPREAMERAPRGENCHYHAWPTEDMAFHRSVKCHWHRDPNDPSIRYVR